MVGVTSAPAFAVTNKRGQMSLSVTPAKNLPISGATVRVVGKGYKTTTGIYVALCVTPPRKSTQAPGPCGGGVNLQGDNPASAWISSNPPGYGKSLAQPFRKGGRFAVTITVSPNIGEIDCRVTSCSIVTRADHLRSFDRTSDLFVPVTFK